MQTSHDKIQYDLHNTTEFFARGHCRAAAVGAGGYRRVMDLFSGPVPCCVSMWV